MGVEMVRVVDNTQKHPEDRQYLICIRATGDIPDEWTIVKGRRAAYEYIKECIDYIDFEESFVLVETLVLAKRVSVYSFMQHAQQFFEDSFDISDYVKGDWDEYDYQYHNEIDSRFEDVTENDRVSMKDFMNGSVATKSLD